METCLYKGKHICAYDVVNMNYVLNYELKKEWKIASQYGGLRCEECGKEVTLRINDPRKRVPHFAHKVTDEKCPFSNDFLRESEEHKKGKMILYNYFKERYPDANIMINHRFSSKRRADLYIEFENENKLAVEYQRTELDILEWQSRHEEYRKLNINILWFLSGKEQKLRLKEKQIEVTFFQQIMLNELDKVAVYLDVEKSKLILAKNMRYSDPYLENNDFEELFIEAYNLSDILIDTNGKIQCDFNNDYNKNNEDFIKYYTHKCFNEEMIRKKEKEEKRRNAELFSKLKEQTIGSRKIIESLSDQSIKEVIQPTSELKRYYTGYAPYKNKIKYILQGDEKELDSVSRDLRDRGNSDDLKIITVICKYHYLNGYHEVKDIYSRLIEMAGFGEEKLEVLEKDVSQLRCPICKGRLIQKYGKFGPFVTCSNYPLCKISFNIL